MDMNKTLDDRGGTHGSYDVNARVAQGIKQLMRAERSWSALSARHQLCLDMVALKMARIISGRSTHTEHWDDIAGYARLGATEGPSPGSNHPRPVKRPLDYRDLIGVNRPDTHGFD